jgi:hypothetical protein
MTAGTGKAKDNASADHLVSLAYGENGLVVDPPLLRVKKGDTIAVHLTKGPKGGTARITFRNPRYFSQAVHNEGDPAIVVKRKVTRRTNFDCDLVVNGDVQPRTKEQPGAGVEDIQPI